MAKCQLQYLLLVTGLTAGGCAFVPELPRDTELPVKEIIVHAACELQDAFRTLDAPQFKRFKADQWLVSITLTPKVDTNFTASGGWTRKGAPGPRLVTWVVGSGPGIQYDTKGQRSGSATYTIKSKDLVKGTDLPCNTNAPTYHVLTRELRVGDWLRRTVTAANSTGIAEVDKPTFNSEITVKFSGSGSYSFAFPRGSDAGGLGGSYQINQQLQIAMTALTPAKAFTVVTLPTGDDWKTKKARLAVDSEAAVQNAKSRLDVINLEQAIQSLRNSQ